MMGGNRRPLCRRACPPTARADEVPPAAAAVAARMRRMRRQRRTRLQPLWK